MPLPIEQAAEDSRRAFLVSEELPQSIPNVRRCRPNDGKAMIERCAAGVGREADVSHVGGVRSQRIAVPARERLERMTAARRESQHMRGPLHIG